MKLEQQVVSLELAQKLKELGVGQKSLFDWVGHPVIPSGRIDWHLEYGEHRYDSYFPAFTVAELGEMLPSLIQSEGDFWLMVHKLEDAWVVFYQTISNWNRQTLHRELADTEADARAAMLVYLLENKLTTL